ncbi:HEXXH motif-containing putative peptide modification protein [Actinosynnema sp. NPDC002837]
MPSQTMAPLAVADSYPDEPLRTYRDRVSRGISRVLPRLLDRVDEAQAASVDQVWECFEHLPAEQRGDIAQHPLFCSWWIKLKSAVAGGDDAGIRRLLPHFGRFVLIPALRGAVASGSATDLRLDLPLSDRGELRFPGHLRHVVLDGAGPGHARLRHDGDVLRVDTTDRLWLVPVADLLGPAATDHPLLATRPAIAGGAIEVDASDEWFRRFFEGQNARNPLPGYPRRDLAPLEPVSRQVVEQLDRALGLLRSTSPGFAAEVEALIKVVSPFRSRLMSTFTDTGFFGTVFISERLGPFADTALTAEHLLHEASHHRLTLLMEDDPLIDADPAKLVKSPWRLDPRPLHQILHGTFVFARIAQFLGAAVADGGGPELVQRYEAVQHDLRDALRTLDEGGVEYTPAGRQLRELFGEIVEG